MIQMPVISFQIEEKNIDLHTVALRIGYSGHNMTEVLRNEIGKICVK